MSADDYLELMQDRDEWRKKCDAQASEIAALKAQRDAMRMALTVLVSYRDYMHPGDVKIAEEALGDG